MATTRGGRLFKLRHGRELQSSSHIKAQIHDSRHHRQESAAVLRIAAVEAPESPSGVVASVSSEPRSSFLRGVSVSISGACSEPRSNHCASVEPQILHCRASSSPESSLTIGIEVEKTTMVIFAIFAHLVLGPLDNYFSTPKLSKVQKGPPESTPKFLILRFSPEQSDWLFPIERSNPSAHVPAA
ncbi:PREDICTED: uncharacterized protein LOC106323573 [Brassica oleracea var. oleracea]|uniref:uncharacterized protein LOC106323573 n=1 Tax=Brassica oleracea var. oleracea TaxID=109376 RepID=UPI0006A74AC6|nr:PREDICTED: uncharacterized protein LOC106323573 [Brassica oleracea var. oleracea]